MHFTGKKGGESHRRDKAAEGKNLAILVEIMIGKQFNRLTGSERKGFPGGGKDGKAAKCFHPDTASFR